MSMADVFAGTDFEVTNLTDAINLLPYKPGRLGSLGLFNERSINTTTFAVEKKGHALVLVPDGTRGSDGAAIADPTRSIVRLGTTHLKHTDVVTAETYQNIRAFGSESESEVLLKVLMDDYFGPMRNNIDTTIEYQRIGAIKGQVMDSDGTTVLLDLGTTFGAGPQTQAMVLGTATTKVKDKVMEAKRLAEGVLGGNAFSGFRVFCSASFFDALTGHAKVEESYDRWQNGAALRDDMRAAFNFNGVLFEEYRGKIGAIDFIADGDAWMVPEGAGIFQTRFAPADYNETVNTPGLPYYAKREETRLQRGYDVEAQSNPISICTRPDAIIKLTVA